MRAGEKTRVPFTSHEEVKKVPWESTLPGTSFGFKPGMETHSSVGFATMVWSLKAVAVTFRAAGLLMPASSLAVTVVVYLSLM